MTDATGPYPRQLRDRILKDLELFPAVAVMGARQVGKTTLARQIGNSLGFAYRTLDDRDTRQEATEDPEGLVESVAATGAVLDEVQRAPDLVLAVKSLVDREQKVSRFLLTGSNQPQVGRHLADSLAGRVAYRTLRPLTLSEQRYDDSARKWAWFFRPHHRIEEQLAESAGSSGGLDWDLVTAVGGMPRVLAAPPMRRTEVLTEYLETLAQRDVREVLNVDSGERLEQLLRLSAVRSGTQVNYSRMASDLGQSVSTVQRWVGAFERSYLITRIPAFSRNAQARVIKAPKLFLVDSALAVVGSGDSYPSGLHFETLVANDLLVWRDEAPGRQLFHWRDARGPEVDFVLQETARVVGVEIKVSDTVNAHDARHLRTFLERHPEAIMGVLLSSDAEIRFLSDRVIAAPWWSVI